MAAGRPVNVFELTSASVEQTVACGRAIGRLARPGDVITLEGPLGAGKTQLVRGLALGLGLDPAQVSSPTFVLMQEYVDRDDTVRLVHLDAYRLSGPEDLEGVGCDDEWMGRVVTAIEWPSRVGDVWGDAALRLSLDHLGGDRRSVYIDAAAAAWADRSAALRATLCSDR
ncbi:MAG: tRNA (adenosine(37)-N6)-threonylcarbamoyltransferase complex ATPase subunit type 1 TsaE [Planctomycetota bacterium]